MKSFVIDNVNVIRNEDEEFTEKLRSNQKVDIVHHRNDVKVP